MHNIFINTIAKRSGTFFDELLHNDAWLKTALRWSVIAIFGICLFSRVVLYLAPKDIWQDEGLIFVAIQTSGWLDILRGRLINYQSAPLLWLIFHKLVFEIFGYGHAVMYFLSFFSSCLSLLLLYGLCRKITGGRQGEDSGNLYVFTTLLIYSLFSNLGFYTLQFKPYTSDLLVSLILLYSAFNAAQKTEKYVLFSPGRTALYIACFLFSSTAILFITGIVAAEVIIAWRRGGFKSIRLNIYAISFFILFCIIYYFFFLKYNSGDMRNYWKPWFIPLDWQKFWEYWPTKGARIFRVLFDGPLPLPVLYIGLAGGSILMLLKKPACFLILFAPIAVTFASNFFLYPPGIHFGVIGGRLLLFLLPNSVLIMAWFYTWLLRGFIAFILNPSLLNYSFPNRIRPYCRMLYFALLLLLVCASAFFNCTYIYNKAFYWEQTEIVTNILHANQTPDSLNLFYEGAYPMYYYYTVLNRKKLLPVEKIPRELEKAKNMIKELPRDRRIFILLLAYWHREFETIFKEQKRKFIKIIEKGTCLYILPAVND